MTQSEVCSDYFDFDFLLLQLFRMRISIPWENIPPASFCLRQVLKVDSYTYDILHCR